MRFNRFALVAGVLALGVAACGDDVQVVEPTPPAPPPPPALSASMAPASAEVMVGSSVVFAVNVSGGVAGEASSWSCASSNTGIATVSVTSAGCQATGVAAGGVTITATVSKGNETANVGSQLTVTAPPAPPAFEASIAPESQSVAVGSSVVFAVNTSGGYTAMSGDMMMAASWTCSSSDPAIATVENTDAGCQATGVSGGEVTVNVAATDGHDTINLVAQLTVTTDPVDPAQPFEASMAPESAEVAVGSNVVFAINTSGGAPDATAEWTCSSSDDAIATAETTDAGCQATGVAGGGVTINAAVTKGDDSASLASQLTVTAPDVGRPAFIVLANIDDDDTNLDNDVELSGRVNATINIDRGDQILESLSLLVDGEVVTSQYFGGAAQAPLEDEAAEQAVLQTFLSFSTSQFEVVDGVGVPKFLNRRDYEISAQLVVAGQEAPIQSNIITLAFKNNDKLNLTLSADGNQAMNSDGLVWSAGSVTASAVPVIYSGGDVVSQIEFELHDVDAGTRVVLEEDDPETAEEDELTYVASITDDEAPFEVTWPNDEDVADDLPINDDAHVDGLEPGGIAVVISNSAFADGSAGPTTTVGSDPEDKSHFVRLDNAGPTVSNLHRAMLFNRHYDITNWVGSGHTFTFSSSSTTPDFSDGGVGRDRGDHEYHAGASTGGELTLVSAPNDLDESSNNRAYVLRATIRDLLGNETMRWWAGADDTDGLSNTGSNRRSVDGTDDYKFGVDLTAPTQELVEDSDRIGLPAGVISNYDMANASPVIPRREVELDYDDPGSGSGFDGSTGPVHTRIRRFAPDLSAQNGCLSPAQAYWHRTSCEIRGDPGSNQWRATNDMDERTVWGGTSGNYDFDGQDYGYYVVEYAVMDDAGNRAPSFIEVGGVLDETKPVVSVLVPADRTPGSRSTLSAFAADNLDLDRVDGFFIVGSDAYQLTSESVGSPSLPFEQSATATSSIENLPAGILAAPTAGFLARALDQAGNDAYGQNTFNPSRAAVDIVTNNQDTDTPGRTINYNDNTAGTDEAALCWDTDDDGCNDGAETRATLTFSIDTDEVLTAGDYDDDATTPDTTPDSEGFTGLGNPFERVIFYVQLVGETDGAVTGVWAELGEARGRAPTNNPDNDGGTTVDRQFSWRLSVRASDLGMTAGQVEPPAAALNIRAVGYTPGGDAVSADVTGGITLSADGPT